MRAVTKRPLGLARGGLLLVGLAALLATPSAAHAGGNPLDPSFGKGGVVVTPAPSPSWNGTVFGLAEDSEGRIIAAGETRRESFGLLRYLPDGSLDRSFRGGGVEREPSYPGGFVETAFPFESAAHDVAVQRDGKIVVAGSDSGAHVSASFALARYDEDGARDPSFGKDGRVLTHLGPLNGGAFALAIQPNGRIIVGGFRETWNRHKRTEGVLIRYLSNGAIDHSFGSHGEVRFKPRKGQAKVDDVALLPSGKILVAGGFHDDFLLARLLPNGSPDPSFGGGGGRVLTDVDGSGYCADSQCAYASSLAVSHGYIVLAGNAANMRDLFTAVTRYRANGKLDRSFGDKGVVRAHRLYILTAEQMVVQRDGKILTTGHRYGKYGESVAALRFLPNGKPDPSFGNSGVFTRKVGISSVSYAAILQRDGKVTIGGYAVTKGGPPTLPLEEEGLENPLESAHFMLMRFR